jgi:hypothetical protein
MRHILTIIFFAFGLTYSFGQSPLSNKWYTFSFDPVKVVEFNFTDTTFSSNKFDWNLKSLPGTETAKVLKIVRKHNTIYYLMQDENIAPKVMVNIFYILKNDTSFSQPSMSEENTYQNDIKSALAFIELDTIRRPGMTFYSQKEFQRLKLLPNANTITKPDYKRYLLSIIDHKAEFENYAKEHKDDFGFMFFFAFLNNQTRAVLAMLGYNPLIPDKELEDINDKFNDDMELQALKEKALKFE